MSAFMTVTLFACAAKALASSITPCKNSSAATCRHCKAAGENFAEIVCASLASASSVAGRFRLGTFCLAPSSNAWSRARAGQTAVGWAHLLDDVCGDGLHHPAESRLAHGQFVGPLRAELLRLGSRSTLNLASKAGKVFFGTRTGLNVANNTL